MMWSTPLSNATAPEQMEELGTSVVSPTPPVVVYTREAVEPVLDVPHRTVSAGSELVSVPQPFNPPIAFARRLYERLTGHGLRTTLLIPETQSDINAAGGANVMKPRQMNDPYEIHQPGPWYESFVRQL
jgi:hypothetical protein